ncbi:hypothetical protein, partial [Streptomyces sp. NPDC102437]|uniref:hypothetical protein n=1 Tax=Streptomyces sp. NPDC102437 TaxID=3366175 RepID=UPI0038298792
QGANPPVPPQQADGWRTPGTLIASVALVLSIVALIPAWDSAMSGDSQAETGKKEAERRGLLEVTAVSAQFTDKLKGVETSRDSKKEVTGLSGSEINIAVRNRGSGSAIITKISANVEISENLKTCGGTGGDLGTSAHYAIEIPLSQKPPFTKATEEDVVFDVKSGENDRFSLTVGPDSKEAGKSPWMGVVTIQLHDADGTDLSIGPLAILSPGEDEYFYPSGMTWKIAPESSSCMGSNARRVREVMQIPGITTSKEFAALHRALRPYR